MYCVAMGSIKRAAWWGYSWCRCARKKLAGRAVGRGDVWNRGRKGASGQVVKSIFPASFSRVGLYPEVVHLPLPPSLCLFSMLQAESLLNSQNSCYSLANYPFLRVKILHGPCWITWPSIAPVRILSPCPHPLAPLIFQFHETSTSLYPVCNSPQM